MPALLLKLLPYLAAAALGAFGMHYLDTAHYDALQAKFSQYQSQVAQADLASQKAATEALQAQIATRTAVEARNAVIEGKLESTQHEALTLSSAHQLSLRLLAAARQTAPTPGSGGVSTASGQPSVPDPAQASSDRRLTSDVQNGALEAADCIERFTALQLELIPQLRK